MTEVGNEAKDAAGRTILARAGALGIAAPIDLVAGRVFATPRVAPPPLLPI